MSEIMQKLKAQMAEIRAKLGEHRKELIEEATELFSLGLRRDEVYVELRDRYIESIPVIASAADDAIDWGEILPGPGGDLLEAIDGQAVETLLRLAVSAAERRRKRRGRGKLTLGELLSRSREKRPAFSRPSVIDAQTEPAPSRSGALASFGLNDGISS